MAVGDRVTISDEGSGSWAIEGVLPRRTVLARPDPFLAPRQQVVAANVDQILVVSSWREPDLWPELIDRYLIAAGLSEIEPVICVNKADLIEDWNAYETAMRIYLDMGYRVLLTSAITGQGVDELRDAFSRRLSVVVGLSGTGKSSLMSAVQPGLDVRIGDVSEMHGQGRHTTTQAVLYKLDAGGYVADTPGIREFGLAGLTLGRAAYVLPGDRRAGLRVPVQQLLPPGRAQVCRSIGGRGREHFVQSRRIIPCHLRRAGGLAPVSEFPSDPRQTGLRKR